MAPVDNETLLLFGGHYDPGIERGMYDDDGNRLYDFDDPDVSHINFEFLSKIITIFYRCIMVRAQAR